MLIASEYTINLTHISKIVGGDTIIHNNVMQTVCNKDIKQDSFMGVSIFGDSYMSGHKLVSKVIFCKKSLELSK